MSRDGCWNKYLLIGIYTDVGTKTCQECPGSYNYEHIDVKTFLNDWNVGYIKVDRCFGVDNPHERINLPHMFKKYRQEAIKYNKNVVISAILAGTDNCWHWLNFTTAQSCRTTQDIFNTFA